MGGEPVTQSSEANVKEPGSGGSVDADERPMEGRPLEGRVIVVTRPEAQATDLVRPLEERGARVVLFPTIRIVPPSDPGPLRDAAARVSSYDWLVFTSVNGVKAFGRALEEEGDTAGQEGVSVDEATAGEQEQDALVDAGDVSGGKVDDGSSFPRVCAIGPATGSALEEIGLSPRVIPDEFVAEAVVEALNEETELQGKRILLPRAAVARSALPEGLRARGAQVDVVEAYRTVPATGDTEGLGELLRSGEIDLVTFTASSTVRNFHRALGDVPPDRIRVAAIGPITAGTARELGYDVVVVAREYTIPGLVEAVEAHIRGRGPDGSV